ncbi:MAG TPA: hypothetical protein VLH75_03820 [Longimicrobiales bacterium]|nr:hypothetical protein [Longimicrobiales bacterium]
MNTDCLELDALIDAARTGAPLAPEVLRHLDGCAQCRADFATAQTLAEALREGAEIPEAWIDRLMARLPDATTGEPTRTWERIAAPFATGALAAATVGLAAVVLQPGAPVSPPSLPAAALLAAIVAVIASTLELRGLRTTLDG